jgi:surfactin synthase thioesterase subunit/phosphopantetheinyl transferase
MTVGAGISPGRRPVDHPADPAAPGRWLVPAGPSRDAETILFCLPHAGGGPSAFRRWRHVLPSAIAVHAVAFPGREHRLGEPARVQPDAIAEAIARQAGSRPYAVYGHSMGARVAFEVVRALRRRGAPLPVRLYVAGALPPDRCDPLARVARLPDDGFVSELVALGGTRNGMLEHPELRQLLLPLLRTDLNWLAGYRYRDEPPLPVPVVAFAGAGDRVAAPPVMLGWARHTAASFRLHTLPGRHFFCHDELRRLAALITADLLDPTPGVLRLPDDDEIHLWLADLDRLPGACAAHAELSPREADHARRLPYDVRRRRHVGQCVVLRRLLRRYGAPVGTAELPVGVLGKPRVNHPGDLRFSLGRSAGLLLVAVTRGHEVGADIERLDRVTDLDAFCQGALDTDEQAELARLPEPDRPAAALRFWTAKEAVVKASGDGLAVGPDRFGFAGQRPGTPWRARVGPDLARLAPWKVTHLPLDGAVAAVAVTLGTWRMSFATVTDDTPRPGRDTHAP